MKNETKIEYASDLEEMFKASSEWIESAYTHMIGVMGMRYLKAKESGDTTLQLDAARNLWGMLELINLQTIFLSNACHASIAIGNMKQKVASMFKSDLGIDPILCKDYDLHVASLNRDSDLNWHKAFGKGKSKKTS